MSWKPQIGAAAINIHRFFNCHITGLAFISSFFLKTFRGWNALPTSTVSSAEGVDDCISGFLVRSPVNFSGSIPDSFQRNLKADWLHFSYGVPHNSPRWTLGYWTPSPFKCSVYESITYLFSDTQYRLIKVCWTISWRNMHIPLRGTYTGEASLPQMFCRPFSV